MWQIVLNGPGYLDTGYELPDGETLLGRGEEMHVVLAGELVSRRHARLLLESGILQVEDAGSRNGTRVNGLPLDGRRQLAPGDVVTIGENRIEVRRLQPKGDTVLVRQEPSASLERLDRARALDAGSALARGPEVAALVLLYQVSERLAAAPTLSHFLHEVADLVLELARARTVVVLLRSGDGLQPQVTRHRGAAADGPPISRSVVDECVRGSVALAVADVAQDARFAQNESVIHHRFGQVICVPLVQAGTVEGVIYVAREADDRPLAPLVEAIGALAHLAGAGMERQRLREQAAAEERLRRRLASFLGESLATEVAQDFQVAGRPRMEEREATILFADISGFTPLTERLQPARVVALLDEFYRRMARAIFAAGGTVDKFIGDAVMAIFGAPKRHGDDALRAVQAALAMRAEFQAMMAGWPEEERCSLKIGLNTGRVLAGTVGGEERLEYTAVGDVVNVAARLVGEAAPGQIVAGGATVAAAGASVRSVSLGHRQLRGRTGAVEVHEVIGT